MASFPLFKLPYLAFKHVIVRLDFIKFAMCSAKCHQIVKRMRLEVRKLTVKHILNNQGLDLEFKQYFVYHWYFRSPDLKPMEDCTEFFCLNSMYYPNELNFNPAVNYVCAVQCLVDFVRDLFKIEWIIYELNANGFTNFQESFTDKIVNRKVVCRGFRYNNGFRYNKPLTQKSIMCPGGKWLTPYHLYNSSFQVLYSYSRCKLTLEDYNLLVKKWLNYELQKNFESLRLAINYRIYKDHWFEDEKNLNILFDGLELKEFDFSRNLKNYRRLPQCFYKPYKLNDIHRDDGMIASFSLCKDNFVFPVWIPGKDGYSLS